MISEVDEPIYAFERNVFVAASAGTGKTHRLTTLYALLTLGLTSMGESDALALAAPILPPRIVATTFSRAAATDIRERVERLLASYVSRNIHTSLAEVIEARRTRIGRRAPNDETLVARATAALDALPRARIDTMHGVAHAICRTNALAIGIPIGARIEEEDETREIADLAIDLAIAAALDGNASSQGAARGLLRTAGGLEPLRDACRALFDRMDEDGLDVSMLRPATHEADALKRFSELRRVARAASAGSGSRDVANAARALLGAMGDAEGAEALHDGAARALMELFALRKISAPRATAADDDLDAFKRSFKGTLADRANALVSLVREAPRLAAAEREILAILTAARVTIGRERARRGVLSFGDLLRFARSVLSRDGSVQRAARDEIDALFVDELQDTSLVQRDIIYLLRETETASARRMPGDAPRAADLVPHGLFLVGDRKQSIYAFRGADVAVFGRVASELCGGPAIAGLDLAGDRDTPAGNATFLSLTESRRSGAAIVDLVNQVSRYDFSAGLSGPPRDFEIVLGPAEALVALPEARPAEVVFVRDTERGPRADAFREARNAALAASHAVMRGFALRDIAILARRRGAIPLLEHALDELGRAFGVAGRALFETREVRDVAALLRLVADPRDRHAMATVVRGPVVGLSDAALLELADEKGLPDNLLDRDAPRLTRRDLAEEAARLRAFRRRFLASRSALARMTPGEAIRQLVRVFELDRVIAALPRARPRLGNLDRLVEIAAKRGGSLFGFSRWLDRQIADETDEAEAVVFSPEDDAIRLTTIHGAKGLDFEAVVLVDLNAGPAPRFPPLSYHRAGAERGAELVVRHRAAGVRVPTRALDAAQRESKARESAERRRLSYVAITRAKRFLALVEPTDDARSDTLYRSFLALREMGDLGAVVELPASTLAQAVAHARAVETVVEPPALAPRRRETRHLAMAATPLGVFRGCERRFELRFLLGLEEPVATGQLDLFDASPVRDEHGDDEGATDGKDPRALGRAAHRVLETWPLERWGLATRVEELATALQDEGVDANEADRVAPHLARILGSAWARQVAAAPKVHREAELGCEVGGDVALSLRGTADLVIDHGDGRIDVVDYKLRRPGGNLGAYRFQLEAYALALARGAENARVRAGILFLEGAIEPAFAGSGTERAFTPSEHEAFAASLAAITKRFADARAAGVYQGIELDACRALRCGFVTACHQRGT